MKTYHITWTIEIDADSSIDAACMALDIQRDPTSVATVFMVRDVQTGNETKIDLDEQE